MRLLKILMESFFLLFSIIPATTCLAQSSEAKTVAGLVQQLTAMKLDWQDQVRLPEPAMATYYQLKRALPELILVNLEAFGNTATATKKLKEAVSKDLQQAGVSFVENKEPVLKENPGGLFPTDKNDKQPRLFTLDNILTFPIPGHDDLIGVVTGINVLCGLDNSFYLYQFKNNKWGLVLAQWDTDLEENLNLVVMDGPKKGEFYVVTGSNGINCTSCWSGLELTALRPTADPFKPEILGKTETHYRRCDGFGLNQKGDVLKVNYITQDDEDPGDFFLALDEYHLEGRKFKSFPWKVEEDRIKKSIIRIYAQGKKYEAEADKMKAVLEKKGFRVKTASVETYIKKKWTNTVRYFHDDDDDLAITVNKLVHDITATNYPLDVIDLSEEFKDTHVEQGAIEIWICDPDQNKKMDDRDSWDEKS